MRTKTEKPSTATIPLIAWYGPFSCTMCHTIAVNTPLVAMPATAIAIDHPNTRFDFRTSARSITMASADAKRLSSGAIASQSIGGTASGRVGALLAPRRKVTASRPSPGRTSSVDAW